MILSFTDEETKKIFEGEYSKQIPSNIIKRCVENLIAINLATSLKDLVHPLSNHLEPLTGNRAGEWSIRINKKWRIIFTPVDSGQNYEKVKIETV